ncbi:MAG: hypothetical protein AB7L09_00145 [Nitrospira sp.]
MTRTFIRQDTQIQSSDVYDDTVAPSLANFETNPTHIETDLNNIRSMLSHLLDVQVGNWYDVISTPVTLETGTQRGVSDLNDALHLVEKKRILRDVCNLVDVTVPASVTATGSITTDVQANYTDGQTFTLTDATGQSITFEFDTVPNGVGGGNTAVDISADTTADNVRDSIISAINGVAGTLLITAGNGGAATVSLTQDVGGTRGNTTIGTTGGPPGTFTAFTGGTGDAVILGTGELPTQTTAAVGAVTTLGTVVATHPATFGNISLAEVSGPNAVQPKNLMQIVDGASRDPILSSSRTIYGLLQGESGLADGGTITDTTTTRVQISFVRINAAGDDLEFVPASDIAGKTINYCTRERVRLEDLSEDDFLKGAIVDTPGATTVTRQVAYDNQGTTPVDLTTNATLDLEGPGLIWSIRDDLEASLFRIIEGSAGGTSEVEFSIGVDLFDNNAAVNDFQFGATINSGGTRPITVGVTDGEIATTAGDLRLIAFNEMFLDDVNQTGSTWAQTDGIKLSETTAEWDAFEVAFGEVSILNAMVQAYNAVGLRTKVQAVVTTTRVADTNINGPVLGGSASVDVNLPAYDLVTFVDDVEVFFNGSLLRNGANGAANEDVYPGDKPSQGDLKFEFTIKASPGNPDVITVIVNGQ